LPTFTYTMPMVCSNTIKITRVVEHRWEFELAAAKFLSHGLKKKYLVMAVEVKLCTMCFHSFQSCFHCF